MKLFTTLTSPYGRIARIVIHERGLSDRIPIEVPITRQPDSPYYSINQSGRVPYLHVDEQTGYEDSALICKYLDHLGNAPLYETAANAEGWALRQLESCARSMLDGLALWGREYIYRPAEIRSATIIAHEYARAMRMVAVFDEQVSTTHLALNGGPLNMAQIVLSATLHGRENSPTGFEWQTAGPKLAEWVSKIGARESLENTLPPRP